MMALLGNNDVYDFIQVSIAILQTFKLNSKDWLLLILGIPCWFLDEYWFDGWWLCFKFYSDFIEIIIHVFRALKLVISADCCLFWVKFNFRWFINNIGLMGNCDAFILIQVSYRSLLASFKFWMNLWADCLLYEGKFGFCEFLPVNGKWLLFRFHWNHFCCFNKLWNLMLSVDCCMYVLKFGLEFFENNIYSSLSSLHLPYL